MLIKWINAVAYSMVSAVMMMILVYPSGILSNTSIEHRLITWCRDFVNGILWKATLRNFNFLFVTYL